MDLCNFADKPHRMKSGTWVEAETDLLVARSDKHWPQARRAQATHWKTIGTVRGGLAPATLPIYRQVRDLPGIFALADKVRLEAPTTNSPFILERIERFCVVPHMERFGGDKASKSRVSCSDEAPRLCTLGRCVSPRQRAREMVHLTYCEKEQGTGWMH